LLDSFGVGTGNHPALGVVGSQFFLFSLDLFVRFSWNALVMFTEGLDRDALKWVQGQGAALHSHDRMDPLRAVRTAAGRGGLGMPPPEKFRSGHIPRAAVPLSRGSLRSDDGSAASGSDMDELSDTEEIEVCSDRYSVESSPLRDDISRRRAVPLYRYATVPGQQSYYSTDDGYSDLSSSRDTALPRPKIQQTRRLQARAVGYVEEDYSDSAGSSEFSSQVEGRSNGVTSKGGYASEYSHNGPAPREVNNSVPKAREPAAGNYRSNAPLNSRTHQPESYSTHVPAREDGKSAPKAVCFLCLFTKYFYFIPPGFALCDIPSASSILFQA
jgi:hypothetical protein